MTIPLSAFSYIHNRDDIFSNAQKFVGMRVVDYDQTMEAQSDVAYRFRSDWDKPVIIPNLKSFLSTSGAADCKALVIGAWHGDDSQASADGIIAFLSANKDKLPNLQALYLGDITSEENEMSWIQQADISPLLKAFPHLQFLRTRGGEGLAIDAPRHQVLRGLALEAGGMDASVIEALGSADFPKLEYLELWLGTDEYGGNVSVKNLAPILSGNLFPELKYLGFRNSDIADEVAAALVGSPIVARLETLDLSLGTLGDVGGQALLKLQSPTLKNLNLHYHYMTDELAREVEKLSFTVDVSRPEHMEEDGDYRYVAVGE